MKHMKSVHKSTKKTHYRAMVKAERCVVCGDDFPNLHNHYRNHLQNQCQNCEKYFSSFKLFSQHECDKPDADPSKVFTSDEDLHALIKSYVPKDEKDDEKFYGYTDNEEEEEELAAQIQNDESQNSVDDLIQQPFVISDVLSLYEKKEELLALYQNNENIGDTSTKVTPSKKSKVHKTYSGPKKKNPGPKKKEEKQIVKEQNGDDSDVEIVDISDDSAGIELRTPIITIDIDD